MEKRKDIKFSSFGRHIFRQFDRDNESSPYVPAGTIYTTYKFPKHLLTDYFKKI